MPFRYPDTSHALREHDFIIRNSGGVAGVKHLNLVESVLGHIQNDDYYPSFEDKITHLLFSFIKNHAFTDGNKRTAIVLAAYFLELNELDFKVEYFIREMENPAVLLANNIIDRDFLYEVVCSLLYEDKYSEELQMKIVHALSEAVPFEVNITPDPF